MSVRGFNFSDSDSDEETELNNDSDSDNKINCPRITLTRSVIKPSRLTINYSVSNNSENLNNQADNPVNMALANATLSDIKEYLEIVPVFKGEPELLPYFIEEAEKIIRNFYDVQNAANPRNDFLTSRIRAKIQGEAALYLGNKQIRNWQELRQALVNAYSDKRDDATLTIEMVKLEQGNDTAFAFYKKIQKLLHLQISYANLNYGANEGLNNHFRKVALKTLLNGLRDPLGSLMRTKDPEDLETALNLLTNTYQKEINFQKTIRHQNQNIQKPRLNKPNNMPNFVQNYNPPFLNSTTTQNPSRPNQNVTRTINSIQNRPVPNQARSNFQTNQTVNRFPKPTPMSVSTNNTYRPPHMRNNTQTNQPKFTSEELFNINDDTDNVIDSEIPDNDDIDNYETPYNNFLDDPASEIIPENSNY